MTPITSRALSSAHFSNYCVQLQSSCPILSMMYLPWKGRRGNQSVNCISPCNAFARSCMSGSSSAVRVLLCKYETASCGSLISVRNAQTGPPHLSDCHPLHRLPKMSRRSSRKVSSRSSYAEIDENIDMLAGVKVEETGAKKSRNVVIDQQVESSTQPIKASPRKAVDPKRQGKTKEVEGGLIEAGTDVQVKKSPAKRKVKSEKPRPRDEDTAGTESTKVASPKKTKSKRKVEAEEKLEQESADKRVKETGKCKVEEEEEIEEESGTKKIRKKRKTKEEKEAEAIPLAARTSIQTLKRAIYIGAHVSGAGGIHNSINNAFHIGGNAFALFLKSQRKWTSPPLADEARDQFLAISEQHSYDCSKHVVPHGSYLVNLAQKDADKAEQAFNCFLDDLQRCEALGIKLYNFHPGNTGPHPRAEAIGRIAANLNKAHKATESVVTLLENMAGGSNVIGSTFEDLRDIIALVDDKSRVGVCIDTCHSFAAGYDLRTPEAFKKTMDSFAEIVGMKYLKALHINDSKAPFSSHRDLHANIGTGFLGLRAFHNVVNFQPFQHLPMVLETPIEKKGEDGKVVEDKGVWAIEIKVLEGLIGADAQSEEFKAAEKRLQDLGAEDRKKFQQQVDKKVQKTIDAMFKKASPRKKKKKTEDETVGSDAESDGGADP